MTLKLFSGGARLEVNGKVAVDKKAEEYEAIYAHFDRLLIAGESYIDAAPFELVADAFMVGTEEVGAVEVWRRNFRS